MLLIAALIAAALGFAAESLARYVPFHLERALVQPYAETLAGPGPVASSLQALAERLAQAADLPEDMPITVHYVDDDTVNAFATLGGHIVIFRGLLQEVPDENALAMVVAHEIAHIKHRHPIASMGRGVAIGLVVAIVSSAAGGDIAGDVLGQAGLLTVLKFSRAQEEQADDSALHTLVRLYGHAAGAAELFQVLTQATVRQGGHAPQFFSTHPHPADRIRRIQALARERGWATQGPRTLLPAALRDSAGTDGPQAAR